MSPEQARGKPVDRRSDVWSFRCVRLRKDAAERPRDIRDVRPELAAAAASAGRSDSVAGRDGAPEESIAVLPFNNPERRRDEFFADGVTTRS